MIAAVVAALTLLFPSGQPASTWQAFVGQSLVPTPSGVATIDPNPCPSLPNPACIDLWTIPPVIHVDRNHPYRRWLLYHEIGHLVDHRYMTPWHRSIYQSRTGIAVWGTGEQFADDYADCARGYVKVYEGFDECAWMRWLIGT